MSPDHLRDLFEQAAVDGILVAVPPLIPVEIGQLAGGRLDEIPLRELARQVVFIQVDTVLLGYLVRIAVEALTSKLDAGPVEIMVR